MNEKQTIQEVAVRILEYLVDMGIAPRTIELFTKLNYRKLYRWMGGRFFRPTLEECARLDSFTKLAGAVRTSWKEVITSWNGRLHAAVRATLYRGEAVKILDSDLDFGEKADKLTVLTFRKWAKEKAK